MVVRAGRLQKIFFNFCRRTTVQFLKFYHGVFKHGEERLERLKMLIFCEKRLSNAHGRVSCEANAGYAPQGWSIDDMTAMAYPVSMQLEALLRRFSWKKVLQIYSRISSLRPGSRRMVGAGVRITQS
jgi:hypothetical protein